MASVMNQSFAAHVFLPKHAILFSPFGLPRRKTADHYLRGTITVRTNGNEQIGVLLLFVSQISRHGVKIIVELPGVRLTDTPDFLNDLVLHEFFGGADHRTGCAPHTSCRIVYQLSPAA